MITSSFITTCFATSEIGTSDETLTQYDPEILSAYEALCDYIYQNNIDLNLSIDQFYAEYQNDEYASVEAFVEKSIQEISQLFDTTSNDSDIGLYATTSPSDETWFFNTWTKIHKKPNYKNYNLLNVVKAGDIVYEAEGGFGITGHIAIVQGIYYSSVYGQYYIGLIEAIGISSGVGDGDGVVKSVLDDDRLDLRAGTILRVKDATSDQIDAALSFCSSQIGKDYYLWGHETSSTASDWYCSELVWAAYYNQGIDIEDLQGLETRGAYVTPKEILDSSEVLAVTTSYTGTPTISNITANSATSVTVSWSGVADASSYRVFRSTSVNGTYSLIGSTTNTSYTNTGLTSGATYYYRVAAYYSSTSSGHLGNSSGVKGARLSFATPIITVLYPSTSTSNYMQWTTVYGATSYKVYRSTSASGTYELVKTTTSKHYTDSGLTTGTLYYYKVEACSSSSTATSAYRTSRPCVVGDPYIYKTVIESPTSVTVKWSNVPDATAYYLYRSTSASGTYTLVATTTIPLYTNTGLTSGTTYYYKVRAYGSSTYGAYSTYSSVIPKE